MMRRKLLAPLLCLVLGVGLIACSSGTTKASTDTTGGGAGESITIGFITKFPVDFYDTMVDAAKEWNKKHTDVKVVYAQGKSGTDDEGEINAIESMITQGVDAIAITPTSPNVQDALQRAVDKGIKVVLVDNDIPGWDGKVTVVATDNLAGGVLAGKFLAGKLSPGDTVAVLKGVEGAPSLEDRVTGFQQGLGGDFKVVATLPTDCDQTKGLNAAQDILTANPDVAAIYGACGPPIIGALEAVSSAGKSVKLVGFDAGPDEVKAIVAGTQLASVAQFPAKMGDLGAQAALDAVNGKSVEPKIDTGTEMVTAANADQFGG
jgi:ABC-type sugar transport system substrate-binding protein